jgi:hypothetical protein
MRKLAVVAVLLFSTSALFAQAMDPGLRGVWTLNLERSDFSGGPKPKMGLVNWTEHGWVVAILTSDGQLYSDGVITDHGCALIGIPSEMSCTFQVVTPHHVVFTLKQGTTVRRVGDIELVDRNTTVTTHHVTPEKGPSFVEKTVWEREQN